MTITELNRKLCKILGIPTDCHRAEIVLEAERPPLVTIERYVLSAEGEMECTTERFRLVVDAEDGAGLGQGDLAPAASIPE